jgi:hypothetical protein
MTEAVTADVATSWMLWDARASDDILLSLRWSDSV